MSLWGCKTCTKSFARKGDLTRHELLHTGIKPHVCDTCGKGFAQFSGLKTHRNVHTKAKPHICGINACKKAFADPSSCTRHRKESHMQGGGPYKCFISGCRTSIKRRSTFVSHLRKHGIDTNSRDLKALISQMRSPIPTPVQLASPDVKNGGQQGDSCGVCSSFLCDSRRWDVIDDSGARSINYSGLPDDVPFDCRLATNSDWSTANNTLLSGSNLDQITPDLAHHIYPYLTSDFENPSCFDRMFLSKVDHLHPLVSAAPLNLPVLPPFLESGSDGFQSSYSSPVSTYSTLYPAEFDDDVFLTLVNVNSAPQEPLLHNIV